MRRPGEGAPEGRGASAARGARGFLERARIEAERYGPDAWIFIRELLQNARDAGATAVTFTAEEDGGVARLTCRDDGDGMTYRHACDYLFALYASSKESSRDQVGRFGVGFWSILRFEPTRVIIRSQPRAGEAWELDLVGDLTTGTERAPTMGRGTEIILERPAGDGAIARRVWDAARQNARFLTQKGDPSKALPVAINGELINAPFTLPPPSSSFRRAGLRGVVGLGNAARVELFSRGLRVRSAATLDDFLSGRGRHTSRSRVQFAELPSRLAPQALLESERLEVLLSRADARENRALRRLVRLAQRELERLLNRQLDAARPLPFWRRWPQALRLLLRNSLAMRTAVAAALGAVLAVVISIVLWGDRLPVVGGGDDAGERGGAPAVRAVTGPSDGKYSDLAAHYLGPQIDDLQGAGTPVELHYRPPEVDLSFAALIFDRFDRFDRDDAGPAAELPEDPAPYVGIDCAALEGCVDVELGVSLREGLSRIPVPTGHRLDKGSVHLDGRPLAVVASQFDQPLVVVDGAGQGVLTYTTGPGAPARQDPPSRGPATLPRGIAKEARALRERPPRERVARLTELVGERVDYTTDATVAAELEAARRAGKGLFVRTLEVGSGDCDVQNALLVALLQEAGVTARLAIGYVGRGGQSTPWFHAWAEYRVGTGPWEIADASASARPAALQPFLLAGAGRTGQGSDGAAGPVADGTSGVEGAASAGTGGLASGEAGGLASGEAGGLASGEAGEPARGQTGASAEPGRATGAPLRVAGRPPTPAAWRRWIASPLPLAGGGLGLLLLVLVARRTRRTVALESSSDLSELLQGVLQHPESFRALPAVFQRPLIPIARGAPLSIEAARELATAGKLFRTRARAGIAAEAIAGGTPVLDEAVPEARTVADALGAVDLDAWEELLTGAEETPLLRAVNEHLAGLGEPWYVIAGDGIKGARTLDLSLLALRRHPLRQRRVIVVDRGDPWLSEAVASAASRPREALFAALDRLAEVIDLPRARRARLLVASAQGLIHEVAAQTERGGSAEEGASR
ncbi:MAG: ATP-binding protein [Nannocystaceae bacterium]